MPYGGKIPKKTLSILFCTFTLAPCAVDALSSRELSLGIDRSRSRENAFERSLKEPAPRIRERSTLERIERGEIRGSRGSSSSVERGRYYGGSGSGSNITERMGVHIGRRY